MCFDSLSLGVTSLLGALPSLRHPSAWSSLQKCVLQGGSKAARVVEGSGQSRTASPWRRKNNCKETERALLTLLRSR